MDIENSIGLRMKKFEMMQILIKKPWEINY